MSFTLLGLAAVALLSFTTEGAIGFGGTVLAASIGAQLVPLDVLLPAFVPLNLVMSAWLLARGFRVVAWRTLAVEVAPPVAIGAAIGLAAFHLPGKSWLILAFAAFVIALAAFELIRPAEQELGRIPRTVLLALGGVVHGLFGTGGPLIVYVVRRRLGNTASPGDYKRAFRSTLAVVWLVLNLALLANFGSSGLYVAPVGQTLGVIAIAIVPGLALGERIHRKLDAARFERVVWVLLLGAGIALAFRSALALV